MSTVLHLVRPEISEQAQKEIDRWKDIANRSKDDLWDERRAKWGFFKIGLILGTAFGVIGTVAGISLWT